MFFCERNSAPPPEGTMRGGLGVGGMVWEYPKRKTDIIFGIPNIENPKIDISHVFYGIGLSPPPGE